MDEELCPISQIEENAAEVKEGIVSTLASQTDPATQIFIKTCVENNKNITYRYIGKDSGKQYDVVIPVSDLKKMLIKIKYHLKKIPQRTKYEKELKAVLFDMDGVL